MPAIPAAPQAFVHFIPRRKDAKPLSDQDHLGLISATKGASRAGLSSVMGTRHSPFRTSSVFGPLTASSVHQATVDPKIQEGPSAALRGPEAFAQEVT